MTDTGKGKGGGRPTKPEEKDPKKNAVNNLQYALDRACAYINDGGASFTKRARTAARNDIPRETVEAGLKAMEECLSDAREAVKRAYEEPQSRPTTVRRAVLSA